MVARHAASLRDKPIRSCSGSRAVFLVSVMLSVTTADAGTHLPQFTTDTRLEPSATRFAGDLRQQNPKEYCRRSHAAAADRFEQAYPRWPEWVAADDTGRTFVYDFGSVVCRQGSTAFEARLAAFGPDQSLIASHALQHSGAPADIYWDRRGKRLYVATRRDRYSDQITVYSAALQPLARYRLETGAGAAGVRNPVSLSMDSRGILYLATADRVYAFRPWRKQRNRSGTPIELSATDELIGVAWESPKHYPDIESIALDSSNGLYVAFADHIVKVNPATFGPRSAPTTTNPGDAQVGSPGDDTTHQSVEFLPGEILGWLGGCTDSITSACDDRAQRSFGYTCSDAACGFPLAGGDLGQFRGLTKIAIDPDDVLYAADAVNLRVQRFTPDGGHAEEAHADRVSNGFLLDRFSFPTDLDVSASHVLMLDRDASLLHAFRAVPSQPAVAAAPSVTGHPPSAKERDAIDLSTSSGLAGNLAIRARR